MILVVAAARQHRIRRQFRAAGALERASARTLAEIGVTSTLPLRRLIRRGVVVPVDDGRYFLNETADAADRHRRRMGILLLIDVLILAGLIYLLYRVFS